jgi:L-histidine N-alpha-methyltransferase
MIMGGARSERTMESDRLSIRYLRPREPTSTLSVDVRLGLKHSPKSLPPKYFYDARGSWLFEQICGTQEYYPTRVEDGLLAAHSDQIIDLVGPSTIVELGSGSSRKTAHLLAACERAGCHAVYEPVDVCREILEQAGRRLCAVHDWLKVDAVVGDYCCGLDGLAAAGEPRLFMFLGGTIGNFDDAQGTAFLREVRRFMGPSDRLLMGADRVKDASVLNAAYNDSQGYTAAFNRNVLSVINRELDAEFDCERFDHLAWFNDGESQIEMHLLSPVSQTVRIAGLDMVACFEAGETILTEISRKFTPTSLADLLRRSGLEPERHYAPANGYYSLVLARPAAD